MQLTNCISFIILYLVWLIGFFGDGSYDQKDFEENCLYISLYVKIKIHTNKIAFKHKATQIHAAWSPIAGTIQEEITRTYSVHAVVDQREKVKLPFHEAVSRGLIDPDKGDYIHNITGIHVPVVEAIKKGSSAAK